MKQKSATSAEEKGKVGKFLRRKREGKRSKVFVRGPRREDWRQGSQTSA